MVTHRVRTILICAGCVSLAVTGCSEENRSQERSPKHKDSFTVSGENVVARATQSRSIVFPLSVSLSESLPELTKVEVKNSKEIDPQALSFAVYACSFYGISWFDSASHWRAIVTPSASSDLFKDDTVVKLSDAELIDCVRNNYGNSFFYQVRSTGYLTFEREPS